ncbi:DUF2169 family type VI secretion system accessory protein [Gilvimarinus japonicus]|uniref:DUF2169 domain-containing protein n=1 Tax=Gilvimarinus japonicus TaxID=1796469 RepID=A0ABV7HTA7_9GAMM
MELIVNNRALSASVSTAFDVRGQEHLVIVAKASWSIPPPGQRPRPLAAPAFCYSDQYTGEPGLTAMVYGNDFALHKNACDIIFDACAHTPQGKPLRILEVGFRIGALAKSVRVTGERYWRQRLGIPYLTQPALFTTMPLHYDLAFGGSLSRNPKDAAAPIDTYLPNPVGTGWTSKHTRNQLANQRAPSLEYPTDAITHGQGKHRPAALGAIGSHWRQRAQYAGTMDEHWQKNIFPFLPEDFDERFHQTAPHDQQMPAPQGGETVILANLVKNRPHIEFLLPAVGPMPVRVLRKNYTTETLSAHADTVFFETEKNRFSVVWRSHTPLQKNLREINCVAVGKVSQQWWQSRVMGTDNCEPCNNQENNGDNL